MEYGSEARSSDRSWLHTGWMVRRSLRSAALPASSQARFLSFDGSFGAENWVQALRVLVSRFDLPKTWLRAIAY